MVVPVTSLDQLDQDFVDQAYAEVTQLMREKHPEVELASGPFQTLVLYFSGVFGAKNQTDLQRYLSARSLKQINADPTLADADIVDDVLSNHRVVRSEGSAASGSVTITINADAATVIPAGFLFTASGQTFATTAAFAARPVGSELLIETDRELTDIGDGKFAFTVTVIAQAVGPAGNISQGTRLLPVVTPNRFVNAYATADFTGGFAEETNAELLDRLLLGDAAKTLGGAINIEAAIRSQPLFERTVAYSMAGMGDAEMTRDQHGIFPVSGGGRVDIYARTRELPQALEITVSATLVDVVNGVGVWQFTVDRDDWPGFYEVRRVAATTASPEDTGFNIVADIRGTDQRTDEFRPDIINTTESGYTRYQTAVIRFEDPFTPTGSLTEGESTADYSAVLVAQPLIADLQDYVSDREHRNLAGDVLVKAAIPCFLSVGLVIHKTNQEDDPDVGAIQAALAARVNNLGFIGKLHLSLMSSEIHEFLTGKQAVSALGVLGRIRAPNGDTLWIRPEDGVLTIPDNPTRLVSPRTTAFILDPNDIAITVTVADFGG